MNKLFFILIGMFFIFNFGSVLSQDIPSFHQFYGNVVYENGSLVLGSVEIEAFIEGDLVESGVSSGGEYGYDELFIVEASVEDEGRAISFYVEDIFSQNFTFEEEGVDEVNLTFDGLIGEDSSGVEGDDGTPGTSGGSPGGGGTPSGGGATTYECVENWTCSEWGECVDGYRKRECVDVNECESNESKPEERAVCGTVPGIDLSEDEVEEETPMKKENLVYYGWLIILIFLVVLVALFLIIYLIKKAFVKRKVRTYREKIRNRNLVHDFHSA